MAKQGPKTAVPRLRFPEFRRAAAWETKPLSALLDYERPERYIVANAAYKNSGTPVLTANKSFILGYTPEVDGVYTEVPVVIFDDFTTDTKYVDFPFKVKSSAIKILKVKGDDSLKVIFELMGRVKFEPKEHKRYYISEYQNLEIAIPDASEQQKIADCLTSLDEVIAAQGRKVEALKAHKRGLMQQLFPREGETRPRLRFPEFRDAPEWSESRLGQLVELQSGATPSKANPEFWNGNIPWVSAKDMKQLFLEDSEDHISSAAIESGAKTVPSGSLLILTRGMTLLKDVPICVVRRDMALNQDVKALRPKDGVESMFLAFLLMASKERLLAMVDIAGHGTGKLDTDGLRDFGLAIPQPEEQQRIADCLSSLDTRITAETQQLAALKTHKQGLMQQLFPALEEAQA